MADFTPGPWWADADGCEIFAAGASSRVAMVGERSDVEVEKANCRLIAAAPDLLEALRELVQANLNEVRGDADDDYVYDELGSAISGAVFKARAAILKATSSSSEPKVSGSSTTHKKGDRE